MLLVRNRLLLKCSDEDNFRINQAFTSALFTEMIELANNPKTNKIVGNSQILQLIKNQKSNQVQKTLEVYGSFFIEEYKHFINIHNMAFPSQFDG